jgi:hypothetical protein
MKKVSGSIFGSAASHFSLTVYESPGCLGCRIHSSPVKGVSGSIFDSAKSQFSLTVYVSTGLWG